MFHLKIPYNVTEVAVKLKNSGTTNTEMRIGVLCLLDAGKPYGECAGSVTKVMHSVAAEFLAHDKYVTQGWMKLISLSLLLIANRQLQCHSITRLSGCHKSFPQAHFFS
jgi:hypothetical protein